MKLPGTVGWVFHRLAGIMLLFGLTVHFYVMHFAGAKNITYEAVMSRFTNPWWIGFDAAFLVLAIYHGFNGLWGIGLEYVRGKSTLKRLKLALVATGCALALVGFYILTLG